MSELSDSLSVATHDLYAVRLSKLEQLKASGCNPFASNWDKTHTVAHALSLWTEGMEEGPCVKVAGRIRVFRLMGKASFLKIQDETGLLQLYVAKDVIGEDLYEGFKKLDLGDIIGAEGRLFVTKTGEITVRVERYTLVSKALRPLPEKWHGLSDDEQIYRQRYLDLIMNDDSRQRFMMRSRIIQGIRQFLWERGFLEFETPVFQNVPGGAAARPFSTHMQALDQVYFLRISLELYLKRLLVGGFDRVFELSRVFRNEGLSRRHNPEFTMLELYQAYTDYRGMMQLVYDLMQFLCEHILGTFEIKRPDGQVINFKGPWREVRYHDLVCEATGNAQWFEITREEKMAYLKAHGLDVNPAWEDFEITQEFYSKRIEINLIQPTFVTHLPRELCPLAKLNPDNPCVLDVFELCINGQEIAPAYSEQNDPIMQRELFEKQIGDDKQNMDEDFLVALEHGMPPAGGMGIGIDRLCVLLTGADSIRDVLLFPVMRTKIKD